MYFEIRQPLITPQKSNRHKLFYCCVIQGRKNLKLDKVIYINMQVPVLHWNGETIAQSMAIARFLAREFNLAGMPKNQTKDDILNHR
jgi:hypothetical protein